MKKALLGKLKESLQSVLPATIIILAVCVVIELTGSSESTKIGADMFVVFIISALFLIIGLTLFTLGSQESMLTIAERIGNTITKKKSIIYLIVFGLIIGLLITIAEPALWVLSEQFRSVDLFILLFVVGVGVAIFLALALLRIVFQIKLRNILIISYVIIFAVVIIVPLIPGWESFKEFVPFAYDSSGVTTGPMAVPFIMSLGLGVSASRNDSNAEDDSFGLVGIASIGPIIAILILGMILMGTDANFALTWDWAPDASLGIGEYLLQYLWQMAIAIAPFIIFFVVFQLTEFKLPKKQVIRILISFLYTYAGLVLFLAGANAGYLPIGKTIGSVIAGLDQNWLLIPIGMVLGSIIVAAEPSVIVLNQQVEDVTSGAISKRVMLIFMSIGMAISIGLAMLRVYTGINVLWILIPGYLIAIILSFISPKKFTAIAIDSGGAVSGAMTSTFLVGFALGAAELLYINEETRDALIYLNAFGLVAFVAMMPLISIQVLGIIYKAKQKKVDAVSSQEEIIELED